MTASAGFAAYVGRPSRVSLRRAISEAKRELREADAAFERVRAEYATDDAGWPELLRLWQRVEDAEARLGFLLAQKPQAETKEQR